MMDRLLKLNGIIAYAVFAVVDLTCAAAGMGVPIFCILLGFFVGWYIARRVTVISANPNIKVVLERILVHTVATSLFTFIVMSAVWGSVVPMLFDPNSDFANFGVPLILYDPKLSFIGWLVLMIFISPFLRVLTTVFGSHVTLLVWSRRH